MVEIFVTAEFESRYQNLPDGIQRKVERQERVFRENPFYSSLHTEKLEPKEREVRSFRIDRSYRVIFRFFGNNKVLFLTVGPHDWVYRLRF